jgi:hypothetical protein
VTAPTTSIQHTRITLFTTFNRDVPQEVVRVLLDHESTQMTAHYARITDQTVRRRWEQATKVNIKGERVSIDPDGPLAQAQWAKTRYGLATQTLPHGYCGLPVQKSCPHANACLTCPMFLTGPECGFRRNGALSPEVLEHLFRWYWCSTGGWGRSVSDGLAAESPPWGCVVC